MRGIVTIFKWVKLSDRLDLGKVGEIKKFVVEKVLGHFTKLFSWGVGHPQPSQNKKPQS